MLMLVLVPRTYLFLVFSVAYYQLKYFFLIVFTLTWMKVFIFIAITVAFFSHPIVPLLILQLELNNYLPDFILCLVL